MEMSVREAGARPGSPGNTVSAAAHPEGRLLTTKALLFTLVSSSPFGTAGPGHAGPASSAAQALAHEGLALLSLHVLQVRLPVAVPHLVLLSLLLGGGGLA